MKKKEFKQKLFDMYNNEIPDQFDEIILKCKKIRNGRKKEMEKKSKKSFWGFRLSIAVSAIILILGISYFSYDTNFKVDSIIDIDVNPSIELKINKKDQIIKYKALNDDAKEILDGMDLEKVDIDIALNAIIGSMVTKGYLDDISNSILISVDNNDQNKAEKIRKELVSKIDNILNTDKIQSSVLSQTMSNNKNLSEEEKLSKDYDISLGKAKLIVDLTKNNSLLKKEDLVNLSINEINVLAEGKNSSLTNVEKQGEASTKAYIGKEKAKDIALNHAKVTNPQKLEIEFDADDGMIVYDVEFETNSYEYDYEIDAVNGNIINSKKEINDDITTNSNTTNNNTDIDYDDDDDDDYDDDDDDYYYDNKTTTKKTTTTKTTTYISSDKAKEIALNHSKISNPKKIKVEFDKEDHEYSVEFIYEEYEYDYEIDAISGKIIDYDKERIDND